MKLPGSGVIIAAMNKDYSDKNATLAELYPTHLDTVKARYDRVLEAAGASHAVIYSGQPRYVFLDDNHYPYKAAANFVCWAPVTAAPGCYIVYTPGEKPVMVFNQPKDFWHFNPETPSGYWVSHFDLKIVHDADEAIALLPSDRDATVFIGEPLSAADTGGIQRVNPDDVINGLHYARGTKTAYELECMRLASRRGVDGHRAAAAAFAEGLSEFGIHRAYCDAVKHTDAELPYSNIVALNEHAAILHYTHLDHSAPESMRSFLIDAGAQVHGYASDITRTYASSGGDFAELIQRMDEMQQDLVGQIRAGLDYRELHIETHRQIATILSDSGISSATPDALVETGATSVFYPHGLGHLLGSQVHDVGGHMADESGERIEPPAEHPFLRLTRTLETDMVITVEPGLYFIDMLLDTIRDKPIGDSLDWARIESLKPFGGIRIEDDVRVLDDGAENLTRDAFRAAA